MIKNPPGNGKDEDFSIVLPLKKRDLGDFITTLLGQQQTIERSRDVYFDIDHAWLVNLHELINQRISQQATANLIEFQSIIHFESGLKRTLSSAEAFKGYVETKKESITAITILWSYLVQFPSKNYPEKQEITFHARIKQEENEIRKEQRSPISITFGTLSSDESLIAYEISHTERTWGDDIETLISNQVDKVVRSQKSPWIFIYNFLRWGCAIGLFAFCMTYPLYNISNSTSETLLNLMETYEAIEPAAVNMSVLSDKLNILAEMIVATKERTASPYSLLLIFTAPFVSGLLLGISKLKNHSFIVMSPHDSDRREKVLRKERKRIPIMFGGYALAVLAGVIGNFAYENILDLFK